MRFEQKIGSLNMQRHLQSFPLRREARWSRQLGAVLTMTLVVVVSLVALGDPAGASTSATASSSWTYEATPNPSGSTSTNLLGVSCITAADCESVGYTYDPDKITFAAQWNGTTWTSQSPVNTVGEPQSELTSVSCTSPSFCAAVGHWTSSSNATGILAEGWNGSTWSAQSITKPAGSHSTLTGVSCMSESNCLAVGWYTPVPGQYTLLAEWWNGKKWTKEATQAPTGTRSSQFYGVACLADSGCTAVGTYLPATGVRIPLAESWNGTTFTVQATAPPPGGSGSHFESVSCASSEACLAVGYEFKGEDQASAVAEAWNGSDWSLVNVPQKGSLTELYGVSCAGTESCTVVGTNSKTHHGDTAVIIDQWNGTKLVAESAPSPGTALNVLNGVACNGTNCSTVGQYLSNTLQGDFSFAEYK
jgi:hypothetical protein